MPTALVVGAGIGGLSAAIGLRRVGWRAVVLERTPEFAPVGAGITLWPNAVRALSWLGVPVRATTAAEAGVRASDGRWLTRWDVAEVGRSLGAVVAAMTRAELHEALLAALPPDVVRLGVTVTDVPGVGEADVVVAADGIDSRLRQLCWPEVAPPTYHGVTTWRGIAPAPAGGPPVLTNTWGRGAEFGVVPLSGERVYWFAARPAPEGERSADERAAVAGHFGGWHDPIPEVLASSEGCLRLDIRHLARPPRRWVDGRVALLGDAAHAMPPNLGQGGGMAIEDAVVLASVLGRAGDVGEIRAALAGYDRARRPRARAAAREAARLGRLLAIGNPAVVAVRDRAMRALPTRVAVHTVAKWSRWTPPPPPGLP